MRVSAFLLSLCAGALLTPPASSSPVSVATSPVAGSTVEVEDSLLRRDDGPDFLRGVNIGGWLILEKWMVPDVFDGTNAIDQWTFDSTSGAAAALQQHWSTWFTEADVQSLKATGINALRIPIGFWAYDNANTPYLKGADIFLEQAVGWAQAAGMKVWIDCHGSPGSQNGYDNSGHQGDVEWQQGNNLNRSIEVLLTLAWKYGTAQYADTVVGLEMVNEPISWGNNNNTVTKQWAMQAYEDIKAIAANKNLMIIMHDAFLGADYWADVPAIVGSNGLFGVDSHLYQCFVDSDNQLTQAQHIQEACGWGPGLIKAKAALPTFVGEWSPVTNICVNPDGSTTAGTSCSVSGCQCQSADMSTWNPQMVEQVRRYVEAQLDTFESSTNGYFMWSFNGPGNWGFQSGIQRGVIPNPVTSRQYPGQCA
ncbi:MAG: exo-1,3-beta-glucanase [Thelocarpon superellum]|nr:MAG: exo-1,3-beta-glucanase [Thelocarpon superellum]